MNPKVKESWVSALRSGQYKQTRFKLKSQGGFCCLGVLCDLYSKETGEEWVEDENKNCYQFLGQSQTLPDKVSEWAELPPFPTLISYRALPFTDGRAPSPYPIRLEALNDDHKKTFKEISDLIEEQF